MKLRCPSLLVCVVCSLLTGHLAGACGPEEQAVRHEWGSLAPQQRIDYTKAVLCMQKKSPRLPNAEYPGVRHRMDDFTATHINYTLSIHLSGIFLAWHRHYLWLWEQALRDECGYEGYQPYWNWPLWSSDLAASPLFDSSETSLSGDGEYNDTDHAIEMDGLTFPRGTGGGCVKTGPFKDMQLHLGPFDVTEAYHSLRADAFRHNPRCFTRSLNSNLASIFTNETCVDKLLASTDIVDFQRTINLNPSLTGLVGIHGGGHFTLGDTMADMFASPQDPAFTLHHGMVDRLWAMWQAGGRGRRHAMYGTSSIWNQPTTPPVSLDTVLEFGVLGSPRTMRELMDPTAFEYCYRYT